MKFEKPIPIRQIADEYQLTINGNEDAIATGINEIHKVTSGDITFVDVEKYYLKSLNSAATIIIINKEVDCPPGKTLLVHDKPFDVYNNIVLAHRPIIPQTEMISSTAKIHPSAIIEPGVAIGHHCEIGADCYIQTNASIGEYCIIGDRVNIHSGAIIGTDAFYFKKENGMYRKWRSGGRVVIGNDVEIGAGCTINKGVSGDTEIGAGSKLDSQVHMGHGAVLGKNCLVAGQVGIAGKTIIGNDVVLYGQVGIAQNLVIGDGAVILAKSGVSKNLPGKKVYFGAPAIEARDRYKEIAILRRMVK